MDILEEYNLKSIKKEVEINFSNEIEKNIFELLKFNIGLNMDEII
jgi:hypothetical protein